MCVNFPMELFIVAVGAYGIPSRQYVTTLCSMSYVLQVSVIRFFYFLIFFIFLLFILYIFYHVWGIDFHAAITEGDYFALIIANCGVFTYDVTIILFDIFRE